MPPPLLCYIKHQPLLHEEGHYFLLRSLGREKNEFLFIFEGKFKLGSFSFSFLALFLFIILSEVELIESIHLPSLSFLPSLPFLRSIKLEIISLKFQKLEKPCKISLPTL